MIDLLSPVGDFDCLKAAVQNGANSVYFGADLFSARAFASNFDTTTLEKAILYAKTRGVQVMYMAKKFVLFQLRLLVILRHLCLGLMNLEN